MLEQIKVLQWLQLDHALKIEQNQSVAVAGTRNQSKTKTK
jgi:hypothetical protein